MSESAYQSPQRPLDFEVTAAGSEVSVGGGMQSETHDNDSVKGTSMHGHVGARGNKIRAGARRRKKQGVKVDAREDGDEFSTSTPTFDEKEHGIDIAADDTGLELGYEQRRTDRTGSSTGFGASGSVDWDEGIVGGTVTTSRTTPDPAAPEGHVTSASAGGTVDVGENGIQGFTAEGSYRSGSISVKGKAGASVTVTLPVKIGDRWVVHWRRNVDVGAGVGGHGKRGSVSAGANAQAFKTGTRTFATEAQARAFHDAADSLTLETGPSPTTLEGAYHLAIGETRGEGHTLGASLGATGSVAGVEVGGTGTISSTSQVEVRRASANIFEVTVSDAAGQGLEGSVGGYGTSVSHGGTRSQRHATTVRFDVTTAEGREAFERYCETGEVPERGGQKIAYAHGEERETYDGLSIAGLGTSKIAGTTWEDTRHDEAGKHEQYGGRRSHDVDHSWVGERFGGKDSHASYQILASQEDDEDAGYMLQGMFSGDSSISNHQGMFRFTGHASRQRSNRELEAARPSGSWRITAELSREKVDRFCARIANDFDYDGGGHGEALQDALRAAGSNDDKMRAIAAFVATGGHKATQALGATSFDVELERDPNFPGRAGRLDLEAKVAGYGALLEASPANSAIVFQGVDREIEALRARRAAVADTSQYADMPDTLRAKELSKIDGVLFALQGMHDAAALSAVGNRPGEDYEGLVDRRAAGEHAPTDPTQRALYDLRDELGELQFAIAQTTKDNGNVRRELRWVVDVSAELAAIERDDHSPRLGAQVNTLRADFVRVLDNPGVALGTGLALKAVLERQLDLAIDVNERYWAFAARVRDEHDITETDGVWGTLELEEELAWQDGPEELELEPLDARAQRRRTKRSTGRGKKPAAPVANPFVDQYD